MEPVFQKFEPVNKKCLSEFMRFSIPGRSSFTATSRPSFNFARCTCAIDAAATDCSSKEAKISSGDFPVSSTINSLALRPENGGRRSCLCQCNSQFRTNEI